MEVVVQASQGTYPAPDTFVSLRVGQVQRHAKYAASRTYRFDSVDPSAKHAVKLEVFKRVGHTTVTFGGSTGNVQDVEVPCADGDTLCMSLASDRRAAPAPEDDVKRTMKHVNSARTYVAQHKLEELLRDSMKEVMKVKPPNPHEFLAAYILRQGTAKGGALPKLPFEPPKPSNVQDDYATAMKALAPEKPKNLPPLELEQPLEQPLEAKSRPQSGGMQRSATEPDLKAKQKKQARRSFECTPKQAFVPFGQRPSVGTWHSEPHQAETDPELVLSPSCAGLVRGLLPAPPFEAEAQRLPFQLRPSVGTWCAARHVPAKPEVVEVPVYRQWKLRPSVGTWCAALPCEDPADESSYRQYQLRPSVGTWCVTRQQLSVSELVEDLSAPQVPDAAETAAMAVILRGRMLEIQDLTFKYQQVSASLAAAKSTASPEAEELERAAAMLESCIGAAKSELQFLESWSSKRGLSPPPSPGSQTRKI